MTVVVRTRVHAGNTFCEFLVVKHATLLALPDHVPERYTSRIVGTHAVHDEHVCVVRSSAFDVQHIAKRDLHSIWLVADDFFPKGAFPYSSPPIEAHAQFMGVRICQQSCRRVFNLCSPLEHILQASHPLSLYHGTATKNIPSIVRDGVLPSFGMLGTAIYMGTLWKAARFACFSQQYEPRQGSVLRCLCFAASCTEFPRPGWACACELCAEKPSKRLADHFALWQGVTQSAHASPTPVDDYKCLLRNEEWAIHPSVPILITHEACIDARLLPPQYDPLNRSVEIL
jgi:hypothetical protein